MNTNTYSNAAEPDPSLVTLTHVTYALHALGLAIGAFGRLDRHRCLSSSAGRRSSP